MQSWLSRGAAVAGAILLLAGCGGSHDPMDFLPESPAYVAFNAEQIRSSAGGKQMLEAAKKYQPESAELLQSRLKRVYLGVEPSARGKGGCGVAIGDAGFGDYAMGEFGKHGATEQKVSGRKVLTSGTMSMSKAGDDGIVLFSRPEDLDKMVRTSEKKNPSARQSATFKLADTIAGSHGIVMATDWSQVLGMIGGQLDRVAVMNPKGVEALKQVRTATATMDWNEEPVIEAILHLPGAEGRDDLASLVNMALGFTKTMRPKGGDAGPMGMLNDLKATTVEDGVSVKLVIPKEKVEAFMAKAGGK